MSTKAIRPHSHQHLHSIRELLRHIGEFAKKNMVLCIALCAAALTSLIVPPDAKYIEYFDFKTLTCLFCILAVVCALKDVRFFEIIAQRIVALTGATRPAILALVYITFIGSMLIANDMALLTFLPLGYYVLSSTGKERYMAFTFIMQNIAANLGGMLTPFGNPQNLYIYTRFSIPTLEFMSIMFMPFIVSVLLITLCCLFVKNEPIELSSEIKGERIRWKKTSVYLVLFAYSIAIVFHSVPYWTGLVLIPASLLFLDREALKKVDYPLLLTFTAFFIFSGNMARIDAVREFFSALLERSTLVFSVLSCQLISNVPSAILLSEFTQDYAQLLRGVNIGGAGTLIASLASLITFREYTKHFPEKTLKYIILFSVFNFAFAILLTVICSIFPI